MAVYFLVFGYLFIAAFFVCEFRDLFNKYRPEWRYCFGKKTVYLRHRASGRLMMCSRNPFTLLLVKEDV